MIIRLSYDSYADHHKITVEHFPHWIIMPFGRTRIGKIWCEQNLGKCGRKIEQFATLDTDMNWAYLPRGTPGTLGPMTGSLKDNNSIFYFKTQEQLIMFHLACF